MRKRGRAGAELQGLQKRLTDRIEELGISQRQLARDAGLARPVVSRLCGGERVDGVTAETVIRLAVALDMTLDWLLRGIAPEPRRDARAAPTAPAAAPAVPPTQIVVMVQPGTPQATAEALAQAAQHFAGLQALPGNQGSGAPAPVKRANKRRN